LVGENNIQIGARLRARRRVLGLSQRVLGQAVGVGFQQIQKYEAAVSAMSAGRLWALAVQLGVGMNYFFDGLQRPSETSAEEPSR
jgi:transcriptional regulator with XRE-family HTH domain